MRECVYDTQSICVCVYVYMYTLERYVLRLTCGIIRVWISGSCRADTEGIIMLVHLACKRLSSFTSYFDTVANGPTRNTSEQVNQDRQTEPPGHLGDQDSHGT